MSNAEGATSSVPEPTLSRRGLITGLISLIAAPAIVRATSLMPIKVMVDESWPCSMSLALVIDLQRRLNEIKQHQLLYYEQWNEVAGYFHVR